MHELALSRVIVETALRHAEGRPVGTVHVSVGSLRQAIPESLAFYFELVARDTDCAGARLEFESVAAVLRCPACEQEWDPAPPPLPEHGLLPTGKWMLPIPSFGCPSCGTGGEVIDGEQLEIDWIEIVEPAPAGALPASERCA